MLVELTDSHHILNFAANFAIYDKGIIFEIGILRK